MGASARPTTPPWPGAVEDRSPLVSAVVVPVEPAGRGRASGVGVAPNQRPGLFDEAVRVARGIPALKARLVHAQTAEVVTVWKEPRVNGHAARLGVRVQAGHPSPNVVRVEDVV